MLQHFAKNCDEVLGCNIPNYLRYGMIYFHKNTAEDEHNVNTAWQEQKGSN